MSEYFAHESAYIDAPVSIGPGTKIWHFCHIMPGAQLGRECNLGQNVYIGPGVKIGDRVKIQNNVSVYPGIELEDDVFLGPSCVLTNVSNPRAQINRHALFELTLLRRGATVGANATIVCGVKIGRYAFIAAGAVVTCDVPDYALMIGVPARQQGWMSRHGHPLRPSSEAEVLLCPESGFRYQQDAKGQMRCLDLDEEAPLPPQMQVGERSYTELKSLQPARPDSPDPVNGAEGPV